MGTTVKRRIFAGSLCLQQVYNVPDGADLQNHDPDKKRKDRFPDPAAYEKHKENISRRNHNLVFHANFSPSSLYGTFTFDRENEIHTFDEARILRRRYVRALKRACPDGVIALYMGRGKSTSRIHFHLVCEGIPEEILLEKWKWGSVVRIEHLRKHCWYQGVDHGQDYTGLANYLFDHWTAEVGGHRYYITRNARKPEREKAKEVKLPKGYSPNRPPRAPKGYILVEVDTNRYGYCCYKYVAQPEPPGKDRRQKKTAV